MRSAAADTQVIDRLRLALAGDALPLAARDHASHLLKRLSSPVRVTLLGKPGSGKSELLNMFVGRRILPSGVRLPTLELTWGAAEQIIVTDAGGGRSSVAGLDFAAAKKLGPAFMRIEVPVPLLQRTSFLEVVTDGEDAELQSAIDWAVRRTDIALWCTQGFDDTEEKLWSRVPDSLKDHAFLVMTMADKLSAQNRLSARIADLETIVAEEFHSLFAVATLQAVKAHRADGTLDEAAYHASGGGALAAEVSRHAERGRRADIDSAQLFLARYQVPDLPAEPAKPAATAPAPSPVSVPEPAPLAAKSAKTAPVKPAEPAPEVVSNVALFSEAVQYLRRRGDGLSDTARQMGPGKTGGLIEQCVDTVEHLVDLFSNDDTGCPAADAFLDELTEASDLMVLMQAESGDAPAADAVTLLLQLRREMEMKLAA